IQQLQQGEIRNYRVIATSWIDSLPKEGMPERPVVAEEEVELDDFLEPRGKESGRRRHRQRRSLRKPGGGVYAMVKGDLAQIRVKRQFREMARVWPDIEKLITLQLESPSGKEFACKSLCNLDDLAKEMDWHQLRVELTRRAMELNPRDPVARSQHADVMHCQ